MANAQTPQTLPGSLGTPPPDATRTTLVEVKILKTCRNSNRFAYLHIFRTRFQLVRDYDGYIEKSGEYELREKKPTILNDFILFEQINDGC